MRAPDGRLELSAAGLLFLCAHTQRVFPQARIAVVQYAGTTMGERFLKREITGPIPTQLDEVVAWLERAIDAVRVSLATAIVHGFAGMLVFGLLILAAAYVLKDIPFRSGEGW